MQGPPLRDGAVLVGRSGRIAAAGPDADVPTPGGADVQDLGDALLLPGLVNTHTHLELTCLRGLVTERPFFRWVRKVKTIKDALTDADYRAAARWGVLESFAAGITTIGDTGSSLAPARAMASLGARGIAYHEVFGPDPDQTRAAMDGLAVALLELDGIASERLTIGVSPHAPYTVSAELLEEVVQLAYEEDRPFAMHLAESLAEWDLFVTGTGDFADMFRRRGLSVPEHHETPVEWAASVMMPELRALLIHCVHVSEDDLWFLAQDRSAVAHCPWSNEALGVGRMRLADMLEHDVRVGLGTDSVAPGRGLDLFEEMRSARKLANLSPARALSLVTLEAARALGVADAGLVAIGAWGDLCAVRLDGLADDADPVEALVTRARAANVTHTWLAGRLVYENGSWPGVDVAAEWAAINKAESRAREIAAGR